MVIDGMGGYGQEKDCFFFFVVVFILVVLLKLGGAIEEAFIRDGGNRGYFSTI